MNNPSPDKSPEATPMSEIIVPLSVVALTQNVPEHGLVCGEVGTVIEVLDTGTFEVEFSDDEGRVYVMVPLPAEQLTLLY